MLDREVDNANNICIIGHINPDGDCIGSALAVYNYIMDNYTNKFVIFYAKNYNDKFSFLTGFNKIDECETEKIIYDLAICVDCASKDRLGDFYDYYDNAKRKIVVDHHLTNNLSYDDAAIIPDITSTAEVLFEIMNKEKINRHVAECLWTGIIHDTGVFRYPSVTSDTHRAAAFLLDKKINGSKIIEDTYYATTYNTKKITAEVILNSKLVLEGRIIYSTLTNEQMKKYNVEKKDIDGIIAVLRETAGIIGALFIYQTGDDEFKVSLRSNDDKFDVSKLAQNFGGGGHKRASGCTIKSNTPDIFYMFEDKIREMID